MSKDHTGFPGGILDIESLRQRDSATAEEQPSELEMHRADHQAVRAAGFHDVGELLDAYKKLQGGASAATVAEPDTDNVWPIVNITVSESGEVTAAKLYAPGLPAGNHDVYPVRVPYMDEHTEAWMAVANALKEVAPGYIDGSGNGIECAVKAIHRLAAQQQAEPGADERAAFEAWYRQNGPYKNISEARWQEMFSFMDDDGLRGTLAASNARHDWKVWKAARAAQSGQRAAVAEDAIEAAAKKLAEDFDYPWEHMPAKGKEDFRAKVRSIAAMLAAQSGQRATLEAELAEWKEYAKAMEDNAAELVDQMRGKLVGQRAGVAEGHVAVPVDRLKAVHRDLDACQKVIWLAGGFDPAYCTDAQARLKEIAGWIAAAPTQQQEALTAADYEEVLADQRRLVRELDVALNGEAGAAKQASLCDIVGQVKHEKWHLVRCQTTAAERDVIAERERQKAVEGWTAAHDDAHAHGDMAKAAAAYALRAADPNVIGGPVFCWPWDTKWWKPTTPRRNLVKAGALILAEIERLDRKQQGE